jgi:hypothetical protein
LIEAQQNNMASKIWQSWFLHLVIGILLLSIPTLSSPLIISGLGALSVPSVIRDTITYFLAICFFYFIRYYLTERYYETKKRLLYYLVVIAIISLLVFLPWYLFAALFPSTDELTHSQSTPNRSSLLWFFHHFMVFGAATILGIALYTRERLRNSEREKSTAELSYLRAQINPHFMFNTLNSIYSLAISRSEKTADAIVMLSGMMRYVTTESHREQVPIEKELDYIRGYIELQKIRLGDTVNIDFRILGSTGDFKITPLVIITFVENAFKYGVNPEIDSDIIVHISLLNNTLDLKIKNQIIGKADANDSGSGLGIANARKRLKMVYPGKHHLSIQQNKNDFEVNLTVRM